MTGGAEFEILAGVKTRDERSIFAGGGRRLYAFVLCTAALLVLCSWSAPAAAYAWMIKHDYGGCNQCHADPSGGGLLTEYGRAQSDFLLRMRYGAEETYEAPASAGFLFTAVKLPENLLLGGGVRYAILRRSTNGESAPLRSFFMQADFAGQLSFNRFRVAGSIGYAEEGAQQARLTHGAEANAVSRTHWIGFDIGPDRNWLLRVGRLNLPFGIRSVEHTLLTRVVTRTDINVSQQHGVALAYNGGGFRAEAMFIYGNLQVSPAGYRERGYSAMIEYAAATHLAVGVSSLVTSAEHNLFLPPGPFTRQAHGAFTRFAPWKSIVLLCEFDFLVHASASATQTGSAGMLQVDFEPTQGLHVMATGETFAEPGKEGTGNAVWGSAAWFFLPHFDLRLDAVRTTFPTFTADTLLAQVHAFL